MPRAQHRGLTFEMTCAKEIDHGGLCILPNNYDAIIAAASFKGRTLLS